MHAVRYTVFTLALILASGTAGCTFGTLPRNEHPISRHAGESYDDARDVPVTFEWAFETLDSVRR
jgi:hypothetical protein